MNIVKYQAVKANDTRQDYNSVAEELRVLLLIMETVYPKTPVVLNIYNLLCNVQSVLIRHETIVRETMFAIDVISDYRDCVEHIAKIINNNKCL